MKLSKLIAACQVHAFNLYEERQKTDGPLVDPDVFLSTGDETIPLGRLEFDRVHNRMLLTKGP